MKKRTQSQVGKLSRRKGKTFERWCARYFTKCTGKKWETTRNSGRTDLKGDIYCVSRPSLGLVVECKHRKEYSVHAMLKPTEAYKKLMRKYYFNRGTPHNSGVPLMLLIKNDTGVWIISTLLDFIVERGEMMVISNLTWVKLEQITGQFNINGVVFDTRRLEKSS